ncbi:hypothetical protein C6P61_07500 [Malikia spinosa]|uniref:Uncharacterized protein n=1 Tax=Malikia spinosa TaxID=86180 RepID=A0A2S9KFD7_9BURK|nr:hypothetical protein C6P61_07500 [Malikia spinosa]
MIDDVLHILHFSERRLVPQIIEPTVQLIQVFCCLYPKPQFDPAQKASECQVGRSHIGCQRANNRLGVYARVVTYLISIHVKKVVYEWTFIPRCSSQPLIKI